MKYKLLLFIKVLMMASLLSGCATLTIQPSIQQSSLSPDNGILSLLVTNNTKIGTPHTMIVARLTPYSGEDEWDHHISGKLLPGSSYQTIFMAELPPGHYRIKRYRTASHFIAPKNNVSARFEIKAGTVSDLGRVIQTEGGSNSVYSIRAPERDKSLDYIDYVFPGLLPSLSRNHSTQHSGWTEMELNPFHRLFYSFSKHSAKGFNTPTTVGHGEIVTGARLGLIRHRDPEGRWSNFYTSEDQTVFSVAKLPDGNFIAAAELNRFYKISKDTPGEKIETTGLPFGKSVFLHYDPTQGLLLVHDSKEGLALYHMADIVEGHWELKAWIDTDTGGIFESRAYAQANDGKLVTVKGKSVYVYDIESGELTKRESPIKASSIAIYRDTWVVHGRRFLTLKNYVSRDEGITWVEAKTVGSDSMMFFDSEGIAYVMSNDKGGMIKRSEDMGQTWYQYDLIKKPFAIPIASSQAKIITADTIIFHVVNQYFDGAIIFGYSIKDKQLHVERIVSLSRLIEELKKRYELQEMQEKQKQERLQQQKQKLLQQQQQPI